MSKNLFSLIFDDKKYHVILLMLFIVFEFLFYIRTGIIVLFVLLCPLTIAVYLRINEKKISLKRELFFIFSSVLLVAVNSFFISSDELSNIIYGIYLLIVGVYKFTLPINKSDKFFKYWVHFSKFMQLQIAFSILIVSIEPLYDDNFSRGPLFFTGSILILYIFYTLIVLKFLDNGKAHLVPPTLVKNNVSLTSIEKNILQDLEKFFDESDEYLNVQFSFESLSDILQVSKNDLSTLIHKVYKVNFYKFIAHKRIHVAIEQLKDLDSNITIESVMNSSGFSSKPTFNKYFKEITGMVPSQFVDKHK